MTSLYPNQVAIVMQNVVRTIKIQNEIKFHFFLRKQQEKPRHGRPDLPRAFACERQTCGSSTVFGTSFGGITPKETKPVPQMILDTTHWEGRLLVVRVCCPKVFCRYGLGNTTSSQSVSVSAGAHLHHLKLWRKTCTTLQRTMLNKCDACCSRKVTEQ